jgi:hypothetical protein
MAIYNLKRCAGKQNIVRGAVTLRVNVCVSRQQNRKGNRKSLFVRSFSTTFRACFRSSVVYIRLVLVLGTTGIESRTGFKVYLVDFC